MVRQASFLLVLVAIPVTAIAVAAGFALSTPDVDLRSGLPWLALALVLALPTQPAVNQLLAIGHARAASWLHAVFALFTFVMMPDPKTSPPTRPGRIAWGISIAVMDGILRYLEIRYSMFFALFTHTAMLPIMRWTAARAGLEESSPWRILQWSFADSRQRQTLVRAASGAPLPRGE